MCLERHIVLGKSYSVDPANCVRVPGMYLVVFERHINYDLDYPPGGFHPICASRHGTQYSAKEGTHLAKCISLCLAQDTKSSGQRYSRIPTQPSVPWYISCGIEHIQQRYPPGRCDTLERDIILQSIYAANFIPQSRVSCEVYHNQKLPTTQPSKSQSASSGT